MLRLLATKSQHDAPRPGGIPQQVADSSPGARQVRKRRAEGESASHRLSPADGFRPLAAGNRVCPCLPVAPTLPIDATVARGTSLTAKSW